MQTNIREWENKVKKYKKQGLSEDGADKEAKKTAGRRHDCVHEKYITLLSYILLKITRRNSKIMKAVKKYLQDMELERAIRLAVGKYKYYFEEFLEDSYSECIQSDNSDDDLGDNDDEVGDPETDD